MTSQIVTPRGIFNYHARGISVTPDNMTPDNSPATLDLLSPWDLPQECHLSDSEKQQIQDSLQQLLEALQTPNYDHALNQIKETLASLDIPMSQPAKVKSTKTALRTDEVDDYDHYFGIVHIQTDQTALSLVRSLITNCQCFLALCHQNPQLSPQHIVQQKQGFVSYIHLLSRVFYLERLS